MVVGRLLCVVVCCFVLVGLLVCSLIVDRRSLFVVRCSLFGVCCLLFAVCCSLFVVR